jgi:predicted RNA-binding protein with PUA-like domain
MRDSMVIGDQVLFYHSNTKIPGIVGLAEIVSDPYPDPTQFNAKSKYYDKESDVKNPLWILVDIAFK